MGLIGDFSSEIRKCLIWAVQFEKDPLIRTEACHSIILLIKNKKDQELIDILQERHLVEEETIVRKSVFEDLILLILMWVHLREDLIFIRLYNLRLFSWKWLRYVI